MVRNKQPTIVKAPESMVATQLATIYGVHRADTVNDVFDYIVESCGHEAFPWGKHMATSFYPWMADVAGQVMADKPGHMIEHLALYGDTEVLLVKDAVLPSKDGLWFVGCGDLSPLFTVPYRSVVNHHLIGDRWIKITAIQIITCLR